jgi:hypothetical protein
MDGEKGIKKAGLHFGEGMECKDNADMFGRAREGKAVWWRVVPWVFYDTHEIWVRHT